MRKALEEALEAIDDARCARRATAPEHLIAGAILASGLMISRAIADADATAVLDEIRAMVGNLDVELENITTALRSG